MKADQDWKEQARQEKERLSEELDGSAAAGGEDGAGPLPPADFLSFVSGLATQTLIHLGLAANPFTGKVERNLDLARYNIDLIGIFQEKTAGNLTAQEEAAMRAILSDLRLRYVDAASGKSAEPGAAAEASAEPGGGGQGAGPGGKKIITP
jgi:hypothetical protein